MVNYSYFNKWGPIDVYDFSSGKSVKAAYRPLERAINEWNVAALIPQLKDNFWLGAVYGLVEEARRLGLRMTVLNAGGYNRENVETQQSQFDQCMKTNFDAIILSPVSGSGFSDRIHFAMEKGVPQVSLMSPFLSLPASSHVGPDFEAIGFEAGRYLAEYFQGETFHVTAMPGMEGFDGTEKLLAGFTNALRGSSVELITTCYGEPSTAEQLKLVNDVLRDYQDLDIIWGTAPTAEMAVQLISDAGLEGRIFVLSAWENQATAELLQQMKIMGFIAQYPVYQARIAVNEAVKLLEGHSAMKNIRTIQTLATPGTWPKVDQAGLAAPADWETTFSVEPAMMR
jgi:protein TorT